jgi:hypothetical protein
MGIVKQKKAPVRACGIFNTNKTPVVHQPVPKAVPIQRFVCANSTYH